MSFDRELNQRVLEVTRILNDYLPKEEGHAKNLITAMNYGMNAGGKRLRPILMMETYRMFGGTEKVIEPFAAAIEMIHTHSLIHDDLPALDNDDFRRGKPTAHRVFGESAAILAGDALLNYAYETALKGVSLTADPIRMVKALQVLAKKTGIDGMLGGQGVDVELTGRSLDETQLDFIYRHKTGALLEAPMMIGAILAGASEEAVDKMERIAAKIGMAFQIRDDILDIISTTNELGKPVHSDDRNQKNTYVALYGMKQAENEVERLSSEAVLEIEEVFGKDHFLNQLVESLVYRKN